MDSNTINILVVEDNPIVAEDLRMKLSNLGYTVTNTANSGEQALDSVKAAPPDIALMDINLGAGINGIETATILKEQYNLSVIYLTAHTDDDTIEKAKITEPYGYIVKPFDDSELKSVIEVAVHKLQVDKQLLEKHTWLETTLNSIGDGVITTDTEGMVTFLNPVAEEKTGWFNDQAKGKHIDEVFHIINEHTGQRENNPIRQVLSTGKHTYLINNTLLVSKNGTEIPIKDCGSPIRLHTGEVLGAVLVFQDDSKAREAQMKLLAQKKEAERYLRIAGVMFIGLDKNGRIFLANDKARQILAVEDETIVGLDWFENFIPKKERKKVKEVFGKLISGKHSPFEYFENSIVNRLQQQRHIAWHNTYIDDENGNIIGILGSGEDITEKLQLQTKLQHAQKMESIGNLAGGIAHDFNNILSAILGFTELSLNIAEEGSELEDNLQEVRSAGMRARDIVSQILYFSRQSDDRVEPTSVVKIARETMKLLRSLIPANIRITEDYGSNGFIMGSTSQLHQIFMNLCTNATQAMEKKGGLLGVVVDDITIDADNPESGLALQYGSYIRIVVSDDGIGIAEHNLDTIFEPYFTTKDIGEGTGMGLAVVHGIIESYGGKIVVTSREGEGTEFSLYIPQVDPQKVRSTESGDTFNHGKEHLLFVDDEPAICKYAGKILGQLGYTVTTLTDPTSAYETFSENPHTFDLLLTDVTMPGMTGDRLTKKVRNLRPDLPVIICSGYSKILHEKEFAELNVQAVALKPLNLEEMERIVHDVLSRHKK